MLAFITNGSAGCGAGAEAPRVSLPVVVDPAGLGPAETDLGYEVRLSEARLMVEDLSFAIAGEAHAVAPSPIDYLATALVPTAHAHPGHYQGGDVTGELPGRFLLRWSEHQGPAEQGAVLYTEHCGACHGQQLDGGEGPPLGGHPAIAGAVQAGVGDMPAIDLPDADVEAIQAFLSTQLGLATLLAGRYESANFRFSHATAADGLSEDEPLLGYTAYLAGVAVRGTVEVPFEMTVDAPPDRELLGAPLDAEIKPGAGVVLGLRLDLADPVEGDTLFDGVDFEQLWRPADPGRAGSGTAESSRAVAEPDADGAATAGDLVRRRLLTHDHFQVSATTE